MTIHGKHAVTAIGVEAYVWGAHSGQLDKQGRDYRLYHLWPVAKLLRPYGEVAYMAGLLHDVLEDTNTTREDLVEVGVPEEVIGAVESVTRREGEPYYRLIRRASVHPLGRLVKLADNWVNLTGLDGLAETDPDTAGRLRVRYLAAREVLEDSLKPYERAHNHTDTDPWSNGANGQPTAYIDGCPIEAKP